MSEINVEAWLQDIYTLTPVVTDKKNSDNQNVTVSLVSLTTFCLSLGLQYVVTSICRSGGGGGGDDNFVIAWGHFSLGFKTFNGGFCRSFQ